MSRIQLALNVADLDASIEFYTKLFGSPPAKVRPSYANFAVADPPLKLVFFAGGGEPGSLNHLGVEVASTDDVVAAISRAQSAELACEVQEATTCCYAVQDKVWVQGPDNAWEFYTVLADAPNLESDGACCATGSDVVAESAGGQPAACCG
jgi:catechol 2,3-dioxygenase-like lactoylglutathione lyase family enzyme